MDVLNEQNGKPSSMRMAMCVCVVTACVLGGMTAWGQLEGKEMSLGQEMLLLLGAGIGGKVTQKGMEKKESAP
jgi:hypothetical protein